MEERTIYALVLHEGKLQINSQLRKSKLFLLLPCRKAASSLFVVLFSENKHFTELKKDGRGIFKTGQTSGFSYCQCSRKSSKWCIRPPQISRVGRQVLCSGGCAGGVPAESEGWGPGERGSWCHELASLLCTPPHRQISETVTCALRIKHSAKQHFPRCHHRNFHVTCGASSPSFSEFFSWMLSPWKTLW